MELIFHAPDKNYPYCVAKRLSIRIAGVASIFFSTVAVCFAQTTIDNGAVETVPGTQPNPWLMPGAIYIGQNGTGSLTISRGGRVESGMTAGGSSGSILGFNQSGNGTVTVDGGEWYDGVDAVNNSRTGGTTAVGGSGRGVLNILNGGRVGLVFLNIGQNANSHGTVVVDGAGSVLNALASPSSGITVGNFGEGSMTVSNGGKVFSNQGTIGSGGDSVGTVDIIGRNSEWKIENALVIGQRDNASGTLNVKDGATVSSKSLEIASESEQAKGTLFISGDGSTVSVEQGVAGAEIGPSGTGILQVADKGRFRTDRQITVGRTNTAAGPNHSMLIIGSKPGDAAVAPGYIEAPRVSLFGGGASLVFNHTDVSGTYVFDPVIRGAGRLASYEGTTVLNRVNDYTGGSAIHGGTLIVGDATHQGAILGGRGAADVTIESNGTLSGTGTVSGKVINDGHVTAYNALPNKINELASTLTFAANFVNRGSVNLAGEAVGNVLAVRGNYEGSGGSLVLNTVLGDDSSPTDKLIINGSTSGDTLVKVINKVGLGALTNEGIKIIEVQGNSAANAFALDSSYEHKGQKAVVAGRFAYKLYHGTKDGSSMQDWYLRSQLEDVRTDNNNNGGSPAANFGGGGPLYQAGIPVYEAYPQALLGLNSVSTLQQRVGNRMWGGQGDQGVAESVDSVGASYAAPGKDRIAIEEKGVWGSVEGIYHRIDPNFSTTGVKYRQSFSKMNIGIDRLLRSNENGKLIGGGVMHYMHGSVRTASIYDTDNGGGRINTNGYGLGGTLTWYAENAFYLDTQGHVTWYDSKLSYDAGKGGLVADNKGFGWGCQKFRV